MTTPKQEAQKAPMTAIREALSAGPTEGPWTIHRHSSTAVFGPDGWVVAACGGYSTNTRDLGELNKELEANASFIAACSPDAIRSLLADLDTLRQRAEKAEEDARRLHEAASELVEIFGNFPGDLSDRATKAVLAARAAIGGTP